MKTISLIGTRKSLDEALAEALVGRPVFGAFSFLWEETPGRVERMTLVDWSGAQNSSSSSWEAPTRSRVYDAAKWLWFVENHGMAR